MNKVELLYNQIKDCKYVIVEGFDAVGKSSLINKLVGISNGKFRSWSVDYISETSDLRFMPYNSRYLLGVSLTNALMNGIVELVQPVLVDRGVISGFVYQELYNQEVTQHFYWYRSHYTEIFDKLGIKVIYVEPMTVTDSKKFYESSIPVESYDQFESFNSYYSRYKKANVLFKKYLKNVDHIIYGNQYVEESK